MAPGIPSLLKLRKDSDMVTVEADPAQAHQQDRGSGTRRFPNALFAIIAFLGILLASYPAISQWVTAHQRADSITGYSESLERVQPEVRRDVLHAARQYNQQMPGVLVTDPYSLQDARDGKSGAWETYLEALRIPDTNVMATVRIPSINVNLPIRHGTSDAVLADGAGHLFGSSLPVGGERTHSVITAHTAFSRTKLFDDLDKVERGDLFHIDVAGDQLTYRVESIDVVLPHEIDSLQLETGRDLVTLVTCAPPTVNTHRLLVRGERVHSNVQPSVEGQLVHMDDTEAGFPWWMLWVGAAAIGLVIISVRAPARRRSSDARESATRSL